MTKKAVKEIVKHYVREIEGTLTLLFDGFDYYDERVLYLLLTKLDGVLWLLLNVLEDLQLGLQIYLPLEDREEI